MDSENFLQTKNDIMKIGFLITARLKSTRLKRKILLDLNGESVVEQVINRALAVRNIETVVLCTSGEAEDDALVEIAEKKNIRTYRGSAVDVMDRLKCAAVENGLDGFISMTADNPLLCIETSEYIVQWLKSGAVDFVYTRGLPVGCGTYGIEMKSMQIASYMKREADTEIWGPFINRPEFFSTAELRVVDSPFDESRRLTCDYPEDYELIRKIFSHFPPLMNPAVRDVLSLLRNEPALWSLNEMHTQRQLSVEFKSMIDEVFAKNSVAGKKMAMEIGKKLVPGHSVKEFRLYGDDSR